MFGAFVSASGCRYAEALSLAASRLRRLKAFRWELLAIACALVLWLPMPAKPAAPAGRYSVGGVVVADLVTWQRVLPPSAFAWADAVNYCESLVLGGFDDWRLPSVRELRSLVDLRAYGPAIDVTAFPSTPSVGFWTSTLSASSPSDTAWMLEFSLGATAGSAKSTMNRLRCVRGL
jgi:hypothetical protein